MIPATQLEICNRALGRIRAHPIASINENSLEARECRTYYPQVVATMLEGPHDWSFATQRVTLAQLTNGRANEWTYAYGLPSNMAKAVRLLPDLAGLGLTVPVALQGDPYVESWAYFPPDFSVRYEIANGVLYSNEVNATLEYAINDIEGVALPQLAARALATELAAYLAKAVKNDDAREKDLFNQAEVEWSRAIAEDRNRQPTTYGDYQSETILARHSGW